MQIIAAVGGTYDGVAPTMGSATSAVGGWSATITNYDAAYSYSATTTAGSVSISTSTITQSGLSASASSTVTVTTTRSGYESATGTVSGTALNPLATPTFSGYAAGGTPGRYKYNISIANYDAANTYTVSVSAGSFSRSGSLITVNGSSDNQSITVYVTASRSGFATSAQGTSTNSTPSAPDPVGTYYYGPVYYPSAGGVPNACGYNGGADGNYGIGLFFVSGPCGYPGDYCAGC